jgi:anti-sigma regulatory factor (Ser/Thr protein kinase)
MEDVNALSALIACTCEEPDKIAMGLMELMLNAVEHGNLGIGYENKSALRKQGAWEAEISHRLTLPEYQDKYASVDILNDADGVTFVISDQGSGFDWSNYLEFDADRVMDNHGRGIAMANQLYFSRVEYLDKGNKVKAYIQK